MRNMKVIKKNGGGKQFYLDSIRMGNGEWGMVRGKFLEVFDLT